MWSESNLDAALWIITPQRMKAGVEHVVVLATRAVEVLRSMKPENPLSSDVVFGVDGTPR